MSQNEDTSAADLPEAKVADSGSALQLIGRSRLVWGISLAALVLAIFLVITTVRSRGPMISIHFQNGYGVKPGDVMRHLGIDVGEVTSVELNSEKDGVVVHVMLTPEARQLAREGSQFWIVRPQLSLTQVSGLETVVGAKYLGVLPGPPDAPRKRSFQGIESPLRLMENDVLEIDIEFAEGHGVGVGDPVKYRGITVGEVTRVRLTEDLGRVQFTVRLLENAERLARVGSQFWIERPDVTVAGVRGLETVVGGHYIAVLPGAKDAEPLLAFDGLESAPPTLDREEGALEIVLQASQRSGLKPGVPVLYRGVRVGQVLTVGLSSDAVAVEARAYILPAYRNLVREKTKFWNISGIDLKFGLSGLQLDADTLSSIALGGVAMATPDDPGPPVATGHPFDFQEEAPEDWVEWGPRLAVGSAVLPEGSSLPHPLRATVSWQTRKLGIRRTREQTGWVLPLADGRLLSYSLFELPEERTDDPPKLAVAGKEVEIQTDNIREDGELTSYPFDVSVVDSSRRWPTSRIRAPQSKEAVLLIAGAQDVHIPIAENRISEDQQGWLLDPALSINEDWHGAAVVGVRDAAVIGFLSVEKGHGRVILVVE